MSILIILLFLVRVFYLVHKITSGTNTISSKKRTDPAKTIICIGSGGHTMEMLTLIKPFDFERYTPRYYIMASTDQTSLKKVEDLEKIKNRPRYEIIKIPRSRTVGQSYITSIFTTFYSILYCIPVVCRIRPDLIVCNGPGTCIPICTIAFLLKAFFICDTRIIYVESFCRTKTFSLSGKILRFMADNIVVQWPNLKRKLKRADFIGQLL